MAVLTPLGVLVLAVVAFVMLHSSVKITELMLKQVWPLWAKADLVGKLIIALLGVSYSLWLFITGCVWLILVIVLCSFR